jgi:hypothetical protein
MVEDEGCVIQAGKVREGRQEARLELRRRDVNLHTQTELVALGNFGPRAGKASSDNLTAIY